MILVRAHVAQQHRRRVHLRHDQIGGAVAIHIGGNQAARRCQLNRIEPERMAHIFKAAVAAIAQHAHLRSGAGFDNRRQIDPSVVIDVDRRHAPAAQRAMQRQLNALESPAHVIRSCHIAPQRESRRAACVTAISIQPSLLKSRTAMPAVGGSFDARDREELRGIFAFARIHVDQSAQGRRRSPPDRRRDRC